jgi:hypothetical protein
MPAAQKVLIFPSGVGGFKHVSAIAVGGVLFPLLLLQKFKVKVIPLVLLSVLFGFLWYFLSQKSL